MDRKNMSLDELIDLVKRKIVFLDEYDLHAHRLVALGYLSLLEDIKDGVVNLDIESIEVVNYENFE